MEQDIAAMTGQKGAERTPAYKLNEVKMSGDDGTFSLREILGEKDEKGHYRVLPLGNDFDAVILKMRWRLTRYDEDKATGQGKTTMTSEYDNKNTDKVVVFGSNEKGIAAEMKVKYNLGSQRVLYVYDPKRKEIIRIIVKASALSGEKNPEGVLGLFEYIDEHNAATTMVHEFITHFASTYREDEKNKRKSYHAMTFSCGRPLTDTEKEKILTLIKEVHEKTTANKDFADDYKAPETQTEEPKDEISPDDIPF
jgi:hypothetical protein